MYVCLGAHAHCMCETIDPLHQSDSVYTVTSAYTVRVLTHTPAHLDTHSPHIGALLTHLMRGHLQKHKHTPKMNRKFYKQQYLLVY